MKDKSVSGVQITCTYFQCSSVGIIYMNMFSLVRLLIIPVLFMEEFSSSVLRI